MDKGAVPARSLARALVIIAIFEAAAHYVPHAVHRKHHRRLPGKPRSMRSMEAWPSSPRSPEIVTNQFASGPVSVVLSSEFRAWPNILASKQ